MTLFGQPFRAAEGDRPALIITRVRIPSHEIGLLTSGVRRSVHAVRRFKTALAFVVALCVEGCLVGATLPDGFTESLVADGLSSPTAMEFTPDGRLFVCQQTGELRVIKDGGLMASPFVTVPVDSFAERGLLGIAFDPGFLTNSFLYVYYTAATPTTHNRVSRFTANGDLAIPASEVVLLDLNDLNAGNHNGGAIHFGLDGQLYIATGDNAVSANSQTLSNLLGKMLRINSDGSIPADNPFYNATSGNNRAIWACAILLRSPFSPAAAECSSTMSAKPLGRKSTMASPAPTMAGRHVKARALRPIRTFGIRFFNTAIPGRIRIRSVARSLAARFTTRPAAASPTRSSASISSPICATIGSACSIRRRATR